MTKRWLMGDRADAQIREERAPQPRDSRGLTDQRRDLARLLPRVLADTEFPEFTRKQIKEYEANFKKYDTDKSGFLDVPELKYMMEKLGPSHFF